MYTFKSVVSDRKDLTKRRRIVTVVFAEPYTYETYESYDEVTGEGIGQPTTVNDERTFVKTLEFSLNEEDKAVKRAFKYFMEEELNQEITPIADIAFTPDAEPAPDADEVAFQAWNSDLQKLVAVKNGTALGLELATPAQLTALTNKVQTGLREKDERYINALAGVGNIL